jgi:tripartite-type tricarboxylate transporter receptor subunit TctC
MKHSRFLVAAALTLVATLVGAQPYPDKATPIRFVVPFGPGTGIDLMARAYSRAMAEQAGVKAIIDNKPGAEGVIGIQAVKTAAADGYTVLWGNFSTQVLNAHMLQNLPYDPVNDFVPVAATENVSLAINAGPSTKFRSIKEVIEAARANPGKLSYGSGSASTRLIMEMFEYMAGVKMLAVPYKTQAQATTALAAGEVDFLATDVPTALPFYKSGQLRPLATTGSKRLSILPDVPTVREQGLADYEFAAWHAVFVPARTPAVVIERLRSLLRDAAKSKYVAEVLASKASEPMDMDTQQLNTLIRKDLDVWGQRLRLMQKNAR